METRGDTVYRGVCWAAFACSANTSAVDVKDGKILRIRPLHYDEVSTAEERKPWKIEARGKVFEPGEKTMIPPLSISYKKRIYSPNRILRPMKRVDWNPEGDRNPQNRGKSKFEYISWDEATDIIAKEIKRIHDEYGPYAILCQADGHGETKVVHAPHGAQANMLDLVGGYTLQSRQPDSWEGWYWGGKHIWGNEPVGMQVNQRNLYKDIAEHGDAMLYWGCDLETTPWGWGGEQPSRMAYFLEEIGLKSFFISPDLNYTGAAHKGRWIPVLPNTDAALQLAIAYVWLTEGTYYKEYVESHTIGFDWFEYYVLGKEDGIPKTPKWAEGKCGVPSYTIKAFARYWAQHAVSIAHADGGGMIRSPFSAEPARLEVVRVEVDAAFAADPRTHEDRLGVGIDRDARALELPALRLEREHFLEFERLRVVHRDLDVRALSLGEKLRPDIQVAIVDIDVADVVDFYLIPLERVLVKLYQVPVAVVFRKCLGSAYPVVVAFRADSLPPGD